ncbi:MAG: SPASM domain-containing protein [Hyphomicrobiales bacterium]|nr:MAG: SPASM domain-containing protein [Hyphomicrobiales bacterium]
MLSLEDLKRLHDRMRDVPAHPAQPQPAECLFIHRTAVVMADGEVVTCANMYAENVGYLKAGTSFHSLWNNERMQSVRGALGTADEWKQCKNCWFREIRYSEQRVQWASPSQGDSRASLAQPAEYQPIAWDFRKEQAERSSD